MSVLASYFCFAPKCGHKWTSETSDKCPKCGSTLFARDEWPQQTGA